jgi:hypothetical protein
MSTPATGIVLSPDDAYTQFKTAEGTYSSVMANAANAASSLAAAQLSKTQSDADLANAQASVKTAADAMIAALQAFEQSMTPPQLPS